MRAWFALLIAVTTAACNDETVEDVPQDVCVSGKRWIGGRRGSEEMYPGRDCVGCHLENDGPQLIAGGTIYGFGQGRDGAQVAMALGQPQSVDCFGIEGVTVALLGADGERFETVTNRAGNFFFEGRPSELAKPFQAFLSYPVPGSPQPAQPSMINTQPSYGGCARCHTPYVVANQDYSTRPPPEAILDLTQDYIDLRLPVAEFLDDPTAYAGAPDDAAHAASVAEAAGY
jgi:hypothetical protein